MPCHQFVYISLKTKCHNLQSLLIQINYRNYTFYRSFGLIIREFKSIWTNDGIERWKKLSSDPFLSDFPRWATKSSKGSTSTLTPTVIMLSFKLFSPFLIIIIFSLTSWTIRNRRSLEALLLCFSFTIPLYFVMLLAFGLRFHANVSRWL